MRYIAALVLFCIAARSARADDRPPHTVPEIALLAAAEASLAVDFLQTLNIARGDTTAYSNGPVHGTIGWSEMNPILGARPSVPAVAAYFGGCALLTAATWYYLPKPWRVVIPIAVMAIEIPTIGRNVAQGLPIITF